MKNNIKSFNVCVWECNSKNFEPYDVMPYFVERYKEIRRKKSCPKTDKDLKDWLNRTAMYMFWSRCQWEIILVDWPNSSKSEKVDVYDQIMMNFELFVDVFKYNVSWKEKNENSK